MKPCKLIYDMQAFGHHEAEFSSWEQAFDYWTTENPPGPLVKTIYLLNLTHYSVWVRPPGHEGNALVIDSDLSWPLPGKSHDPKYYTGRLGMGRGHPINNESFNQEAYNKAIEDRNWDQIYFRKTGRHWQEQDDDKGESKARPDTAMKDGRLNRGDCLKLLDLKSAHTKGDLKKAYNKAVKMNHPDKVPPHLASEFKELAEHRTKQINQAYDLLMKSFK